LLILRQNKANLALLTYNCRRVNAIHATILLNHAKDFCPFLWECD